MKVCVKGYCYNRPGTRKGKKTTSKKKACKPGTLKRYGKVCGCKTVGGGFKAVKAYRCKR